MKNQDFEGAITYVHNAKKSINQTLLETIKMMNEEQLRQFLLTYLEDKQNYENEFIKIMYESKNLDFVLKMAEITHTHGQNLNNNLSTTMAPIRDDSKSLEAILK